MAGESNGACEDRTAELVSHCGCALRINIADAHQINAWHLAQQPDMMTAEGAGADHGHAYFAHESSWSGCGLDSSGAKPTMAMPDSLARRIISSLSSIRVRPASTATAVVLVSRMVSIVDKPMTGTSNSRWPRPRDTFTRRSGLPLANVAARRSMASVPSMASAATQARSLIATLWPMSAEASTWAMRRP